MSTRVFLEGAWTSFPSILADGQFDRGELPTRGIVEIDFEVSAVTSKNLEDCTLATCCRIANFDTVSEGLIRSARCALVVSRIVLDVLRTRARHVMFPERVTPVHARRLLTRRYTHFELGQCR